MKKLFPILQIPILSMAALAWGILPVNAQFGPPGGGGGPQFGGALGKLFGDNQAFSATMQMVTTDSAKGNTITVPGKFCMDTGKTRFEINLADIKGGRMPANAGAQLKAMGMDNMISISRPDLKVAYLIYPGTQSYLQTPLKASDTANPNDFKTEITAIGKETVSGHDCVKNKVVVTGKDGVPHESTVWNATDLKQFPIKIVTGDEERTTTMTFTDISTTQPAASSFEPPAGYAKYDNIQSMMQQMMMKRMGQAPPQ